MDIPPPSPPSPEDTPQPGPDPFGPPPPPPPPAPSPYETPSPYGTPAPYGASAPPPPYPQYPQGPYGQPPYGQGAYPGYGYPPPYAGAPHGWYAAERTTNGLAIASLITSFTCIPFVGAILGVVGLRQIRRRPQRGRGMAIAGLVLNSLGTAALALVITLGVLGVFDEGNTRVQDLAVGDCFNTVDHSLSDYSGGGARSTTVDVVPCGDDHDAETYAVFAVGADFGSDYPGVDRISSLADSKCASYAHDYLGGNDVPDGVDIYYYLPPREGWDQGDRHVTCFFGGTSGKLSGSVKGGHGSSGVGV